ncbi:MAG TPA: 30S ribosomal protein S19 [Candidatus Norongarragalinales archaeon]|nr:30S ribosomal protein S19 [Candidatus Norongarragalinales archaeon]
MARKFTYKGKSVEELQKLSHDEFVKMLPSKLRRSMRRGSVPVKKFMEKFRKRKGKGKPIKTHVRQMPILPEMIGQHFKIYNGKDFVDFIPTPESLGHRLGEFSIPIKQVKHSGPGIGATRGSKAIELK